MSNENLWEDDGIFVDIPEETDLQNQTPSFVPEMPVQKTRPVYTQPAVEDEVEEVNTEALLNENDETEEDYSQVLNDANLRLEQGNLYKLIMNHDLFSGVDADPRAIKNVQKEIKKFAKDRMEIMLGMKKELHTVENISIDFPFNSLEIEVLKKLASTATKGASENSQKYTAEIIKTKEEVSVNKNKLNTIGNNKAKKELSKVSTQTKNTLKNKPTAPIKRSRLDLTIDQIAREENIPRELLEENLPGMGGKPVNEMSEEEMLERNRLISKRRQPRVKSNRALPMASFEQQQMLAMQQAGEMQSSPLMNKILEAVKNMPIKN